MPKFFYKAVSLKGESITGEELAQNEKELAQLLKSRGFLLTHAKAKGPTLSGDVGNILEPLFGVSLEEKLMFTRNLKVMISSGVSLPKALEVLGEQTRSKKLSRILQDVKEKIVKGETLSLALASHEAVFGELFLSMVKVGEESGTLEQVLSYIALQLEKEYELRSKIFGALLYPAVVVSAMVGVGILMLIIVVPQLAKTFQDLRVQLPLTTRLVIALGNFMQRFWYVVVAFLPFSAFLLRKALRTKTGKRAFDTMLITIPVFRNLSQKINSARTARTLSSLIEAGVPIVRSLDITSKVVGNSYYREVLEAAREAVQKGSKLSEVIKSESHLYPLLVAQMLEVGEETGKTSEVLGKLAEFFEDEVSQVTKNFASLVEPILMLVIGAAVGFFAISMLQPMYSLLNAIQESQQ